MAGHVSQLSDSPTAIRLALQQSKHNSLLTGIPSKWWIISNDISTLLSLPPCQISTDYAQNVNNSILCFYDIIKRISNKILYLLVISTMQQPILVIRVPMESMSSTVKLSFHWNLCSRHSSPQVWSDWDSKGENAIYCLMNISKLHTS